MSFSPKLDGWSIILNPFDGYTAPESLGQKATGKVYHDSRFTDGEEIVTSRIVEGKVSEGGYIKTQTGSYYFLGNMSEDYKKWLKKILT